MDPHHDAPLPPGEDRPGAWDDALCRLEDVLLAAPFDRALPNLDELLARAGVTRAYLHADDRALKLVHEAVLARPFADPDEVHRSRTHVEMMMLEVEVLTGRLASPDTSTEVAAEASARLDELAEQLRRVRDDL